MRCVIRHPRAALSPSPSREACSPAQVMSFILSVMVRCAPSKRFTMREPRTAATVLSECSET
jgi:hypothetical protein